MNSIQAEIESLMRQLAIAKPRSRRKISIETKLCMLRMRQLKQEIRAEKRKAA